MGHTTLSANVQPTDSVPADSFSLSVPVRPTWPHHLRFRVSRLSQAIPAIERIVRSDRQSRTPISEAVWPLYVAAVVELASIRGELGVLDDMLVDRITDTIGSAELASTLWSDLKAAAERNGRRNIARAVAVLSHAGEAKVRTDALVDLKEVAVALDLRGWRKASIFPRGANGRRPMTGLPTVTGPETTGLVAERRANAVAYTVEQRRDWCTRLGFKPDTISKNARTLSSREFHDRIAKREAELLPAEKLSGRRNPGESDWAASIRIRKEGPKTRNREFGVTAARRAYCEAFECSRATALRRTGGLDAGQVMALVHGSLSPEGQIETDKNVPRETDKKGVDLPFSANVLTDHGNERPRFETALAGDDIEILKRWFETTKRRPLTRENLKKWKQRGKLDLYLFAACEWFNRNGDDADLRNIAQAWLKVFRERDRARRQAERHRKAINPNPLAELDLGVILKAA